MKKKTSYEIWQENRYSIATKIIGEYGFGEHKIETGNKTLFVKIKQIIHKDGFSIWVDFGSKEELGKPVYSADVSFTCKISGAGGFADEMEEFLNYLK